MVAVPMPFALPEDGGEALAHTAGDDSGRGGVGTARHGGVCAAGAAQGQLTPVGSAALP